MKRINSPDHKSRTLHGVHEQAVKNSTSNTILYTDFNTSRNYRLLKFRFHRTPLFVFSRKKRKRDFRRMIVKRFILPP